jgi:hypothetical protein
VAAFQQQLGARRHRRLGAGRLFEQAEQAEMVAGDKRLQFGAEQIAVACTEQRLRRGIRVDDLAVAEKQDRGRGGFGKDAERIARAVARAITRARV